MSIPGRGPSEAPRADAAHRSSPDDPRLPELDAVRGIAAVAIVVYHANQARFPWGWAAVDLFFVLSGFLITSIILRHGGSPGFLPRFYARRSLRIWPAYFLVTLAVVACRGWLPRPTDLAALPYNLTFTQAVPLYWTAYAPRLSPYLGHTWTLAIEEQFYLLWPALILLVGRGRLAGLALATLALGVWARASGLSVSLLGARPDGLALGGLLAALLEGRDEARTRALRRGFRSVSWLSGATIIALSLTVGVAAPGGSPPRPTATILAFNLLWFAVVGLVATASGRPGLAVLRSGWLRYLGTISYGLYLYHLILLTLPFDLARRAGHRVPGPLREVPPVAASFLLAALSWRFVESPILRLKGRFAYNPAGRGPTRRPSAGREPARRI